MFEPTLLDDATNTKARGITRDGANRHQQQKINHSMELNS